MSEVDGGLTAVLLIDGPLEGSRSLLLDTTIRVDDDLPIPDLTAGHIAHYYVSALFDVTCVDCSRSEHKRIRHRKVIARFTGVMSA